MKILSFITLASLSIFAATSHADPSSCAKVAVGASYTTIMKNLANQWHLIGVKLTQPNVYEITLHNDEDGYAVFLVATQLNPQTGICHVTGLKQEQ